MCLSKSGNSNYIKKTPKNKDSQVCLSAFSLKENGLENFICPLWSALLNLRFL